MIISKKKQDIWSADANVLHPYESLIPQNKIHGASRNHTHTYLIMQRRLITLHGIHCDTVTDLPAIHRASDDAPGVMSGKTSQTSARYWVYSIKWLWNWPLRNCARPRSDLDSHETVGVTFERCHVAPGKRQVLQHTATHCNILQHTATQCNTLQHTLQHTTIHNDREKKERGGER